jgi:hypothetical protein
MIGLLKAIGVVKVAVAVGTLTAVTAFAATQVSLPAASDGGQAHASAAAANGEAANPQTGKDVSAITDRLAANKARLLSTLNNVLSRLQANANVNQHAVDALQKVIDRTTNGDTGLNRANDAVTNGGSSLDHPTASNHPGQP